MPDLPRDLQPAASRPASRRRLVAGAPWMPPVLDFEASGFGPDSYPIEVGFVLPRGQALCTLIRPLPGWTHWDTRAAEVHGISRRLLDHRGRDAIQVAHWLNRHLRDLTVYCDGWAHDYVWMHRLYEAAGQLPSFRLDALQRLFAAPDAAGWDTAKAQARETLAARRHRASSDARVLQRAFSLLPSQSAHAAG